MATHAEQWAFHAYIGQVMQRMNPDHGSSQDDLSSIAYADFDTDVEVRGSKAFISDPDDPKPTLYVERNSEGIAELVVSWDGEVMAQSEFPSQIADKAAQYLD